MRNQNLSLLVSACACLACSCATAFKPARQPVHVIVEPEGADVRSQGVYAGEAPADIQLDRQPLNNMIDVTAPGHEKQTVVLQHHADMGWFVWDFATCVVPIMACVPLLADVISGKWYTLDEEVHVKLDPVAKQPAAAEPKAAAASAQ